MTGTGPTADDGDAEGESRGDDAVRCWLVDRTYDDKGLVRLVYATPDGARAITNERSAQLLSRQPATAAVTVDERKLEPVDDEETRERYAGEVARMRDRHDPSDEV